MQRRANADHKRTEVILALRQRPGTKTNPDPTHWRIVYGRHVAWVLDTSLHTECAPRPASRRWVPRLVAPYGHPASCGLDPCATLSAAVRQLAERFARVDAPAWPDTTDTKLDTTTTDQVR